jgi:preprotein translocase subunit SecA
MEEDVPIESKLITKRIAAAQKAVETQNFEARKHLLEYDDVMNKQRQAVYGMRRQLLEGIDQRERILDMVRGIVNQFLDVRVPEDAHPTNWDLTGLRTDVLSQFGQKIEPAEMADMSRAEMEELILERLTRRYQEKEDLVGPDIMRQTERMIMLQVIDDQWKDHLLSMDHLKEGIGLRGYGQKDPLVEYKKESYVLFQDMMDRIEDETVRYLFFLQVQREDERRVSPLMPFPVNGEEEAVPEPEPEPKAAQRALAQTSFQDFTRKIERKKEREMADLQFVGGDGGAGANKPVVQGQKVGRNDPCPCGSGKKYKKCHGA